MEIKHITSDSLRRLLSLTEKKELLIKAVTDVENEIASALKGAGTAAAKAVNAVTPFAPVKKAKPAKKSKASKPAKAGRSGGLKDQILALLDSAGAEGLRVKHIAEKLGVKAANVSVWFSTTGKKITTKVEPGRYAKKGAAKSAAPAAKVTVAPVKAAASAKPAKKKKRNLSPEVRAKLASAMKARWAAKKMGKPAAAAKASKAKKRK